ncbi:MAG TPA: NAD-dependent deacylase [Anaerolineae bacterium]|nr:NAD-dependent deacylase [Anaerolineae bacterium]
MEINAGIVGLLREAKRVVVFTGAGVSAESGVPTFRDAQTGLWAKYRAEDLATPQAFKRQPKLVWEWYVMRRRLVAEAKPNAGHYALAKMEEKVPTFVLITQNIDNLHQQAGSYNVLELHGNIARTKCFDMGHVVREWEETGVVPPLCPRCGSMLRPDVVWFGENLSAATLDQAFNAAETADIFFSIGTSSLVQPAASLPVTALNNGVPTIEVNPNPTPLTPHMSASVNLPSGEFLPALVEAVWPE